MDRQDKLKSADELEEEMARAARPNPNDDLRAAHDDLIGKLEASRRQITLADLNNQLFSIDDHLAHIQHNTETQEQAELHLRAIERNTKATMESAKAANGNLFAIALMAAFWSAFFLWKNFDDMRAFFQAVTSHIFHPFS
jgi:hypothetical protein